jgi:hypothetical protein
MQFESTFDSHELGVVSEVPKLGPGWSGTGAAGGPGLREHCRSGAGDPARRRGRHGGRVAVDRELERVSRPVGEK